MHSGTHWADWDAQIPDRGTCLDVFGREDEGIGFSGIFIVEHIRPVVALVAQVEHFIVADAVGGRQEHGVAVGCGEEIAVHVVLGCPRISGVLE